MKFEFTEDPAAKEAASREGLHVQIMKADSKNGFYAAVYNKFGFQVSETEYGYRKKFLKGLTVEDFKIDE